MNSQPCARLDLKNGCVEMHHGAGGRAMNDLINGLFCEAFSNPLLNQKNDQACFEVGQGRMVMTTDSFVISPLFFPGGNIGSLAVHGTVNDLAMGGAQPLYLTAGFILEEGFPLSQLENIVRSMAEASRDAGVAIVTGDTKVVERGKGDGVFINTAGVGRVYESVQVSAGRAKAGHKVIVSGSLGDHGVAVLSQRQGLHFETALISDAASLHGLVKTMIDTAGSQVHVLRDPTRGGVASTLNEIADQSKVGVRLQESCLPIKPPVRSACELLGLDPLNVANEGKLIAVVDADAADTLVGAMQQHPLGKETAIIGEIIEDPMHLVRMVTPIGGERVVDWLHGEQLPRIC